MFAEGVDVGSLKEGFRVLVVPGGVDDFTVGRAVQAAPFWEALVPDGRVRCTVSREHFKINIRREESGNLRLSVSCFSLNGLLLNSEFIQQGSEFSLKHDDVIAFAAKTDSADGNTPRKPFLAFNVEFQDLPSQTSLEEVEDIVVVPPEGSIAGCWHHPDEPTPSLTDVLFIIEVHGENIRKDLPSAERQLFFCYSEDEANPPTLRVGRHYQSSLWEHVLDPGFYAAGCWAFMDKNHFEIRMSRLTNPNTREPTEWRCRVKVLSIAGLKLNYAIRCNCGEEYDLHPSNTLTVETHSSCRGAASNASGGTGEIPGIHFTFIPMFDSFTAPIEHHSRPIVVLEKPRQLPELLPDESFDGNIVLERNRSMHVNEVKASSALQAPIEFDPDGPGDLSSAEMCDPPILVSMDYHCDDLFSRTGFQGGVEDLGGTKGSWEPRN